MEALKFTDSQQPVRFINPFPKTYELVRKVFWLRLVVGLLLLSNLVIGGIAIWALRSSDNAYNKLLESKLPLLEKLGNIGLDYSRLQRRHLNLFLVAPKDEAGVRADCQALSQQANLTLQAAHGVLGDAGLSLESAELEQFSKSYLQALKQFDQFMLQAQRTEASEYARITLRPALEGLLRYVDQLDSRVRGDVLRQAELISKSNSVLNRLMFGLAGWPLFFTLGAVSLLLFIIVILLFFGLRLRLDERE